jgi:hypothetical protein
VYPDSYKPGALGKATVTATDNPLGFESSDVVLVVPGSRFRVIDSPSGATPLRGPILNILGAPADDAGALRCP